MTDVLRRRAIRTVRLHVDLPDAPEEVEIVHEDAAHKRLQRPVDRAQIHALLQRLVVVYIGKDLRDARNERRGQGRELGAGAGHFQEFVGVLGQEVDALARTILQHEGNAARGANAGNSGRRERERLRLAQPGEPLIEAAHDDVGA